MRRRAALLLALALSIVPPLAGCTQSGDGPTPSGSPSTSASPDAAAIVAAAVAPGPYATRTAGYELADLRVPGLPRPVEVWAHVVGPEGAAGPLPLVVLLHGYNGSCWNPDSGDTTADWPCRQGFQPIPSFRGFEYLQQRLASQGYLTASVSAHGVNVMATNMGDDAGAEARAALVGHHLDAWASGEVTALAEMAAWPEVDMASVMLVGHSRGGEGVDRTVAERDADAAWTVRGEVLIAPTAFEPAARGTVPVVAFTGTCDGDVGPGPGQRYVDRPHDPAVLRSAILLEGANHNFFNAEWVPGTSTVPTDADDVFGEDNRAEPACEPGASTRLTAAEQQDVAARVVGLAAAAFLRGRAPAADVLDGRVALPVAGSARAWVSALGRGRTTLVNGADLTGTAQGPIEVDECNGISETEDPDDCGAFSGEGSSVHWPGAYRDPEVRPYLELSWDRAGGSAQLRLAEPIDLSGAAGVEARIVVAPDGSPAGLDVVVTDADGASAVLPGVELTAFPEGERTPYRRWGQRLFAPLAGASGVDLARVVRVDLTATSPAGHAWLIDLSALPADPPA